MTRRRADASRRYRARQRGEDVPRQKPGPSQVPIEERFWAKVDRTPGCWLWTANQNTRGYGQTSAGGLHGRKLAAHRVSWELTYGPIPPGAHVLHRCDTPLCVRPDHLFLGSMQDNHADMMAKRRHRHHLDGAQAAEMRRGWAAGNMTQHELAERYQLAESAVRSILRGTGYTWAEGPTGIVWRPVGERNGTARLTRAQVEEIRAVYASGGVSQRALARRYGVASETVRAIVHHRTWRDTDVS